MSSIPSGNSVHSESSSQRFFHLPLYVFAGLLCVWLAYSGTVMSMYEQWMSSASYSHGVVVVPVTLYFIWMRRRTLLDASFAPSLMGHLALLVSGLLWVLGELAVNEGAADAANVEIIMADADFADLIAGKLNSMAAFTSGKLKVKGDMTLSLKLGPIFGIS